MNMQTAVELTTVPVIRRAWAEARKAPAFTVSDTFAGNAVNRLLSRYYTIRCNNASEFFGQSGAALSPRLRNDDGGEQSRTGYMEIDGNRKKLLETAPDRQHVQVLGW
jgi:hypothetical protein